MDGFKVPTAYNNPSGMMLTETRNKNTVKLTST